MDIKRTERTPHKCFRCGSVDHLIYKSPKTPKYNKKRKKQVCFNERGNSTLQRKPENSDDDNDKKIYALMSQMSGNDNSSSRDFGDSP